MANKRADGKAQLTGWFLASTLDRVVAVARRKNMTRTDAVAEALDEWLDRHDPAQTTEEQK